MKAQELEAIQPNQDGESNAKRLRTETDVRMMILLFKTDELVM